MFHLALGLLALMLSTSMIEVSAVGLHLTVSGKPKLGILVLHHLIGVAVAFVNRWREWRKCISDVGKAMKQSGIQVSETSPLVIWFLCVIKAVGLDNTTCPIFAVDASDGWCVIKIITAHTDCQLRKRDMVNLL